MRYAGPVHAVVHDSRDSGHECTCFSPSVWWPPGGRLIPAWQASRFQPVLSSAIFDEYLRTLAYPKFGLTPAEIRALAEEEILPFFETVDLKVAPFKMLRDPDDAKFVECALAASVPWIVSGDSDLLGLGPSGIGTDHHRKRASEPTEAEVFLTDRAQPPRPTCFLAFFVTPRV